jgi:AraC-like DNA-binding protein
MYWGLEKDRIREGVRSCANKGIEFILANESHSRYRVPVSSRLPFHPASNGQSRHPLYRTLLHEPDLESTPWLRLIQHQSREEVSIAESLKENTVRLLINFEGSGTLRVDQHVLPIHPFSVIWMGGTSVEVHEQRFSGQQHRAILLVLAARWLANRLGALTQNLRPVLKNLVEKGKWTRFHHETVPLALARRGLFEDFESPPVPESGVRLWYRAKILEIVAAYLCGPGPEENLFCTRQKRTAMERVDRVIQLLHENLAEPLPLSQLAKEAGCSPHYLSRLFSQETGHTMGSYIRRIRIEKAAELLRDGRMNVTEAAMEVGYSSLSHFSKAFREITGCCPGIYPYGQRRGE